MSIMTSVTSLGWTMIALLCSVLALPMFVAGAVHAEPPPQRLWIRQWDGPGHHSDEPKAILTLADHSVMVAAGTHDPTMGGPHPALLRYDAAGKLLYSIVEP